MQANQAASHRCHVVSPHAGLRFNVLEISISVKAVTESYTIYEAQVPPYFAGLPPHVHRKTSEWYYILSGTLAFTLGEETSVARAGTLIQIHPHVIHTFWNPSAVAATLLSYRSQPDFAEYLAQLTDLLAQEGEWPPADMTSVLALAAQYDQFPPERIVDTAE